jgi:type IV secretion system protein VirB10
LREALVAQRTTRFDRHRAGDASQGDSVQRELERVAQQRAALGGATDPAAAYQQAAAQAAQLLGAPPSAAQAMTMGAGASPLAPGAPNAGQPASSNARNDLRAFGNRGAPDRWQLPSQVEDPPSPYMLQAGSVIGAVLDSAVNSELPGPLIGHVSQPVYSSTGSHQLLIPQGTNLFGEYSADVVFGQSRLLVAWQRLRFPNGQTLDIGAMPGTDGVGRSGFEDQVNNHYFRLFGSALLLSLITTGVTLTQTPSSSGPDHMSAGSAMSQALGLQFGQVTAQLLQKNLNVAPTIEIRTGFRFNIVVTQDLTFRGPYTEK